MANTIKSTAGTPSISAMELRSQPGTILDRVFYRRESIIIKRSGKPRAAIVPLIEFEQMKRARADAKKRLFAEIERMRKAFAKEKPEKVKRLIEEAIKATRSDVVSS